MGIHHKGESSFRRTHPPVEIRSEGLDCGCLFVWSLWAYLRLIVSYNPARCAWIEGSISTHSDGSPSIMGCVGRTALLYSSNHNSFVEWVITVVHNRVTSMDHATRVQWRSRCLSIVHKTQAFAIRLLRCFGFTGYEVDLLYLGETQMHDEHALDLRWRLYVETVRG